MGKKFSFILFYLQKSLNFLINYKHFNVCNKNTVSYKGKCDFTIIFENVFFYLIPLFYFVNVCYSYYLIFITIIEL